MNLTKTFVNTKVETKRKINDNYIEDDECQGQWYGIEKGLWRLPLSQCRLTTPEVEATNEPTPTKPFRTKRTVKK